MIGRVTRRLAPAGVLVGVALAGCDTVGSINRTGGVAVVEEQTKEASGANISSLSEVIQRNPSDPAAYNTRGAAYARLARYADAINDFNKAVQVDPNYAAGLRQPGAGLPADQPQRRGACRFQPRHRGRPVLRAGLSRPRQPLAGAGQLPGRPRRPVAGDPPQPGGGGGLPRPRPRAPAPGRPPRRDSRFRRRHRPQPLRRPRPMRHAAKASSRPASTTRRSRT